MPDDPKIAGPSAAKAAATFFRPLDELQVHRGNLPHWRQDGVTYFITTRLADSMPQEKLHGWQQQRDAWLSAHGIETHADLHLLPEARQHEFHSTFTQAWHAWLDAGHGECHLRRPEVRGLLIERLCAEPTLDAWVIMPNHLHALVAPQDKTLGDVMQSWKGGSAFAINRLLGRSGPLWQKEPYDHIIRSEVQWQHYRRYIADNPSKAGLRANECAVGIGNRIFKVASALAESLKSKCG